jgi:hypothetical protein
MGKASQDSANRDMISLAARSLPLASGKTKLGISYILEAD